MSASNRIFKHIVEQPFIAATGAAALVHSTWSLGTLFSGTMPAVTASITDASNGSLNGVWVAQSLALLGWLLPAFAIAFAMDVGQIVTSHDIQQGNHNRMKYATFFIFAIATYYLQWLYMMHHAPLLAMGEGVSADHAGFATSLRNLSIYIVPALLPLSTLMYTFSHKRSDVHDKHEDAPANTSAIAITVNNTNALQTANLHTNPQPITVTKTEELSTSTVQVHTSAPPAPRLNAPNNAGQATGEVVQMLHDAQRDANGITVTCPYCKQWSGTYATDGSASSASKGHLRRCKTRNALQTPVEVEAHE